MKTEEEQLAAVKDDGHAIQYIKIPSEEVQLAAVEQNKDSILCIEKPTRKVLLYLKMKGL